MGNREGTAGEKLLKRNSKMQLLRELQGQRTRPWCPDNSSILSGTEEAEALVQMQLGL
jgi:hypothetical protein